MMPGWLFILMFSYFCPLLPVRMDLKTSMWQSCFFSQDGRGQLAPAVRRVADSCRSHSTASSSTLPHCHRQHRRWGGRSQHRKSDFPLVFFLTWSGRCLLSAQSPTGVLMLPFNHQKDKNWFKVMLIYFPLWLLYFKRQNLQLRSI